MDKSLTKQLLRESGILTPDWRTADLREGDVPADLPCPCVIKPCGCGSSVGVSIVDTPAQLAEAVEYARRYEQTILIEEKIEGRQFSLGVLDGKALPAIEIIPRAGFTITETNTSPALRRRSALPTFPLKRRRRCGRRRCAYTARSGWAATRALTLSCARTAPLSAWRPTRCRA